MRKTPTTLARELYVTLAATPEREHRARIRAFLAGLAATRKTNLRPRIVAAFTRLALAAEGKQAGTISTAQELDGVVRTKLKRALKTVVLDEKVDPALMGGTVLQIEDARIDGSVRGKLEALKKVLTS